MLDEQVLQDDAVGIAQRHRQRVAQLSSMSVLRPRSCLTCCAWSNCTSTPASVRASQGVSQYRPVASIAAASLRKGQARVFALQDGIVGEARIVERAFGVGPCALSEAIVWLQDHLASAET